jgi:hypothetical protein
MPSGDDGAVEMLLTVVPASAAATLAPLISC